MVVKGDGPSSANAMFHLTKGSRLLFLTYTISLFSFSLNRKGEDLKTMEMGLSLHFQVV